MNSNSTGSTVTPTESVRWVAETSDEEQADLKSYLGRVFASPFLQRVAAQTLAALDLRAGNSVLEVGCGTGVFLPLLGRAVGSSGRVVGIDHSASMVREAQAAVDSAGGKTAVQEADACHLPFENGVFDAAHCERVLMHLDDPARAIFEMARVVRPGGRVVAAEPDWAGIRIDHPDRLQFDTLYRRSLAMTQPDMGLTLVRLLAEAGLINVEPQPVMGIFPDLKILKAFGLNLDRGAQLLAAEGILDRSKSEALISELEELNAAGRFYAAGVYHVVVGVVPRS